MPTRKYFAEKLLTRSLHPGTTLFIFSYLAEKILDKEASENKRKHILNISSIIF